MGSPCNGIHNACIRCLARSSVRCVGELYDIMRSGQCVRAPNNASRLFKSHRGCSTRYVRAGDCAPALARQQPGAAIIGLALGGALAGIGDGAPIKTSGFGALYLVGAVAMLPAAGLLIGCLQWASARPRETLAPAPELAEETPALEILAQSTGWFSLTFRLTDSFFLRNCGRKYKRLSKARVF
jgi:hypothetical protein